MDRLFDFFSSRSFVILLFHVGVLLFNWPLLSLSSDASETSIFSYIIITWFVVVCMLIIMSYCINRANKANDKE